MLEGKSFLEVLKEYMLLTLGTIMYVFVWVCMVAPNNFSSGGLTGLCTILQFATNGLVPVKYTYIAANAVLLVIAFLIVGKGFGIRTIYCILLSELLFIIVPHFESLYVVEGNFFYIPDKVLIPMIAGILEAVGLGIVLKYGGSTGGSDIVAVVVNKFWPVSMGKVFLVTDLFIIASILLLPGKTFQDTIYGYIMMIVFSIGVDYILLGGKSTVQVLVFSEHYDEIADYINDSMDRGVTAMKARGWYTKQDREVLLILIRKKELHNLTAAIKAIDPKAFVSVSPASSVYGEGFEEIKTGITKKKTIQTNIKQ